MASAENIVALERERERERESRSLEEKNGNVFGVHFQNINKKGYIKTQITYIQS